jgi:adenylyltransferase/sulfurtransferase
MASGAPQPTEISVTELKAMLDRGEQPMLLDVREPFEWNIANLGDYGAQMIPLKELVQRTDELRASKGIVVYCRSGSRSAKAADYLRAAGFGNVLNLHGGILAWAREVDPSVQTY